MSTYEQLALDLARVPLDVYGVYRTTLESGTLYDGHVRQPTSKCAVVIGLRGRAEFLFDGTERYALEPGRVLIGGWNRRLAIRPGPDGFEYCLIHYLPAAPGPGEGQLLTGTSMLQIEMDPETQQLIDRLVREASSPDGIGLLAKKALFYRLLSQIMEAERQRRNKISYTVIDDAILYIQSNYTQPLTLDGLAERYRMKGKYFSYLFHKYTGLGPIEYWIRYRMNRAHELLSTGQYTVSAVARSVGYLDAYYFSRLFKKYIGQSPGKVQGGAPPESR